MRLWNQLEPEEAASLASRYPEDVKPPRKFSPYTQHTLSVHEGERDPQTPATTAQQRFWKGDAGNGIANVDKITSVRAQQLDERVSACQRATDDRTDTHKTARKELGHDVGAGGTTAPADAAFFPFFFFPFAVEFGLRLTPEESTGPGGATAAEEEPHGLPHHRYRRLPGLSSRSSLSLRAACLRMLSAMQSPVRRLVPKRF